MRTHTDKVHQDKNRSAPNESTRKHESTQKQSDDGPSFQFINNRSNTAVQKKPGSGLQVEQATPSHSVVDPWPVQHKQSVQRQIHQWEQDKWNPGESKKEGTKKLPDAPPDGNTFFNDVTGQAGKTKQEAAGLEALVMNIGSVAEEKINLGEEWDRTAEMLTRSFGPGEPNQTINLGYFTINSKDETWKWDAGGDGVEGGAWTTVISSFLSKLMIANGQMDHIRAQQWYQNGTHEVQIDVNFYLNRLSNDAPLYWHKDTGGGNIFVNLIFSNKKPIVGTEWTPDTQPVSEQKRRILEANMPGTEVDEMERARAIIAGGETDQIHTGLLPPSGYVSWIDELIWHSSPFMSNRKRWSKELAIQALTNLSLPAPFQKEEQGNTLEAMLLIANTEGSWLRGQVKQDPRTIDGRTAAHFFKQGYKIAGQFNQQVQEDIGKVAWDDSKIGSMFGHANDGSDPRVAGGPSEENTILSTTGTQNRKRALSDPPKREEIRQGADMESPRNFLRTWVRVKPRAV